MKKVKGDKLKLYIKISLIILIVSVIMRVFAAPLYTLFTGYSVDIWTYWQVTQYVYMTLFIIPVIVITTSYVFILKDKK